MQLDSLCIHCTGQYPAFKKKLISQVGAGDLRILQVEVQ